MEEIASGNVFHSRARSKHKAAGKGTKFLSPSTVVPRHPELAGDKEGAVEQYLGVWEQRLSFTEIRKSAFIPPWEQDGLRKSPTHGSVHVLSDNNTVGIFTFMGIDLRWEDENGEQLAELGDREFLVARFLPPFDAPDFPCLRFVDPAGDTVFNQAQITQLVSELERLSVRRHDPKVERHLQAVLAFVRQAVGEVHTYIKFYGD